MKNIYWLIVAGIITLSLVSYAVVDNVYAAFPYSMTYTPSTGNTILSDHINTSNNEHINNNIPESIDDYSVNAAEMQTTRDPYPASVVSLATTLSEELGGIRHVIQAMTQETYWYIDPPTFCEDSSDFDHGTGDYRTGGKIVLDGLATGISTDGSINFGTDTAAIWSDGTDLFGTSTSAITITTGLAAADDFTINATAFVVEGDNNNIGIGIASPDGRLHVHTATAGSVTAEATVDDLIVENSGDTGISILSPDANTSQLMFGSPTDASGGDLIYDYNAGSPLFRVRTRIAGASLLLASATGVTAVTIDASQDVLLVEDITPDTDNTGSCGTAALTWNDHHFTLSNGADYCYQAKTGESQWRTLELQDYYNYPAGIAFGNDMDWRTGDVVGNNEIGEGERAFPQDEIPVFAISKDFIEFNGVRITSKQWKKLAKLLEDK